MNRQPRNRPAIIYKQGLDVKSKPILTASDPSELEWLTVDVYDDLNLTSIVVWVRSCFLGDSILVLMKTVEGLSLTVRWRGCSFGVTLLVP